MRCWPLLVEPKAGLYQWPWQLGVAESDAQNRVAAIDQDLVPVKEIPLIFSERVVFDGLSAPLLQRDGLLFVNDLQAGRACRL